MIHKGVLIGLGAVGLVLLVIGIVLLPVLQSKVKDKVNKSMVYENGSEAFNNWEHPPADMYMQFWMFDVINGLEVLEKGAKPIVREKGPYTYREIREKRNVTFDANGTKLTYQEPKSYVFVRNMSVGDENDTFTSVNFPALTVASMLRLWLGEELQKAFAFILNGLHERLFETYTVGGYLWGFEEPTLKQINDFTRRYLNITLIKNDKFGLFFGPTGNGSNDGEYSIFTGASEISKLNQIDTWKGSRNMKFWTTKICNMINGTDGSGWHPDIKKDERLYLFSSDICRSIYAEYEEERETKGIPLYRFVVPSDVFEDAAKNQDNEGFCTPDCLGAGVLNVSSCKNGAPLIMSQPHFYQGASRYINAVEGLKPDASQHRTFIDVEPVTGAPLHVAKKLQVNFYLRRMNTYDDTLKLSNDTIFPVLWLNESALVTDDGAAKLKGEVMWPIKITKIVPYTLIAVGAACLLIAILLALYAVYKSKKDGRDLSISSGDTIPRRGLLADSVDQ